MPTPPRSRTFPTADQARSPPRAPARSTLFRQQYNSLIDFLSAHPRLQGVRFTHTSNPIAIHAQWMTEAYDERLRCIKITAALEAARGNMGEEFRNMMDTDRDEALTHREIVAAGWVVDAFLDLINFAERTWRSVCKQLENELRVSPKSYKLALHMADHISKSFTIGVFIPEVLAEDAMELAPAGGAGAGAGAHA